MHSKGFLITVEKLASRGSQKKSSIISYLKAVSSLDPKFKGLKCGRHQNEQDDEIRFSKVKRECSGAYLIKVLIFH